MLARIDLPEAPVCTWHFIASSAIGDRESIQVILMAVGREECKLALLVRIKVVDFKIGRDWIQHTVSDKFKLFER